MGRGCALSLLLEPNITSPHCRLIVTPRPPSRTYAQPTDAAQHQAGSQKQPHQAQQSIKPTQRPAALPGARHLPGVAPGAREASPQRTGLQGRTPSQAHEAKWRSVSEQSTKHGAKRHPPRTARRPDHAVGHTELKGSCIPTRFGVNAGCARSRRSRTSLGAIADRDTVPWSVHELDQVAGDPEHVRSSQHRSRTITQM